MGIFCDPDLGDYEDGELVDTSRALDLYNSQASIPNEHLPSIGNRLFRGIR